MYCMVKEAGRAIQANTRIDHQAKRDLTQKSTKVVYLWPGLRSPKLSARPECEATVERRLPQSHCGSSNSPLTSKSKTSLGYRTGFDWMSGRRDEVGKAYRQTRLAVSMVGSLSRSVGDILLCFLGGLCSSSSSASRPLFLQHPC